MNQSDDFVGRNLSFLATLEKAILSSFDRPKENKSTSPRGHPSWEPSNDFAKGCLRLLGVIVLGGALFIVAKILHYQGHPEAGNLVIGIPAVIVFAMIVIEAWRRRTIPIGEGDDDGE
jgi:hypothetical protein